MAKNHKKADQYNDPKHNYLKYWEGRDYEDEAERIAIRQLLKGRHFSKAVDIGGGYGRLCLLLENFAQHVTLAEPSQQQLDIAKDFLKGHPEIDRKLMQADNLKFDDNSMDLITMIRVMHHLPDPTPEFGEIARVLADGGVFILEIANYSHFVNRIKHAARFQKLPAEPVDIRSAKNRTKDEVAFVNHNPKTVIKQLAHAGLKVEEVLSVSNFRSTVLKKSFSKGTLVAMEKSLQKPLSKLYFGPSIFLLVTKAN